MTLLLIRKISSLHSCRDLFASEPLKPRVLLASLAILGAIVLIRRGERRLAATPPAAVARATERRPSAAECAQGAR